MKSFGDEIKNKRNKINMSQQDLANFVGVSRATISQVEGEQQNPAFFVGLKISRLLGIDLNRLELWDEEIKTQKSEG